MDIARELFEIKTLTQTLCNSIGNESTNTEIKVLYFIDEYKNVSPALLISKLNIVKSNLANITKKLLKEDCITSQKSFQDKRSISYSITPYGKKVLEDYLEKLRKLFAHSENANDLELSFQQILDFLNKKV